MRTFVAPDVSYLHADGRAAQIFERFVIFRRDNRLSQAIDHAADGHQIGAARGRADGGIGRTEREVQRFTHQRLHGDRRTAQQDRLDIQADFIEETFLDSEPKHVGADRLGADTDGKFNLLLSDRRRSIQG